MLIVDHFKPDSSQNRLNLFELQLNTLQYIAIYIYKEVKFYKLMPFVL